MMMMMQWTKHRLNWIFFWWLWQQLVCWSRLNGLPNLSIKYLKGPMMMKLIICFTKKARNSLMPIISWVILFWETNTSRNGFKRNPINWTVFVSLIIIKWSSRSMELRLIIVIMKCFTMTISMLKLLGKKGSSQSKVI